MRFISLFSGIGGLDLGLERSGMRCVAQVEVDDFCQRVLSKHWPDVPKFKDVKDVGLHNLPTAELICGGFPCQDVSLSGHRLGLEGERSTLWTEFYRVVCEIQPEWVVVENVTGLLSSDNGEFFATILWQLSQSGYDAEWDTIPASAFGAPHRRDRIFIVAHATGNGLQSNNNPKTSLECDKKRVFPESPRICFDGGASGWATKSSVPRILNGVPNRVDRIRATGNAVVPQVAEFVGRCIMDFTRQDGRTVTISVGGKVMKQ
jgi:DNA (cytosine-5)-methyltransferase 1